MRALSCTDFTRLEGQPFAVRELDGALSLTLEKVERLSESGRDGGAFRLEFSGPGDRPIGQGTYRFVGGGFDEDIFIVPIAHDAKGYRYEAVFN